MIKCKTKKKPYPILLTNPLIKRYGSKKAFVTACWSTVCLNFGAFHEYRQIQWQKVSRLVFICKGNICRSAYAKSRFLNSEIKTASAGLDTTTGALANEQATLVAKRLGCELKDHRSTSIKDFRIMPGDLLIGFEPWHGENLKLIAKEHPDTQVTLLGLWCKKPMAHLHDPYGLPEAYFENCFKRIDCGIKRITANLNKPIHHDIEPNNWRNSKTILVTDSHTIGSLGVIRSLGRAGYKVIAISHETEAIGFYSNYCQLAHTHTSYSFSEDFIKWLFALIEVNNIDLIIPSEAFMLAIRGEFHKFRHLLPLPQVDKQVFSSLSKYDLFSSFNNSQLLQNLPPFILVDFSNSLPTVEQLRKLGKPLFIKTDAIHSNLGNDSTIIKCMSAEIALEQLAQLQKRYSKVLVQGYVDGIGVGAFLACWQDRPLGIFMHKRIHEVPHWGGMSSFRASWSKEEILTDALDRMKYLKWQGVGMFEYRWDPQTGRFYLMEFNSRFWGSLHLALFAGVDFPCLLADAYFGVPQQFINGYRKTSCRLTFPKEIQYVISRLKDKRLSWDKRLWPIVEFIGLSMNPRIHSDLNFPGDRAIYLRALFFFIRNFLKK